MVSSLTCLFLFIKTLINSKKVINSPSLDVILISLYFILSRALIPFSQHRYVLPYIPLLFIGIYGGIYR